MADPYIATAESPIEKNKYFATLDLCSDCRLTSGAHVMAWTFIPRKAIEPRLGGGEQGLEMGSLKTYKSSKDANRAFCGTCGATIFFDADPKHEVVDVSVGVLRAPEGVAAETWLTWRMGKISWYDSGEKFDSVFAKSLRDGAQQWAISVYGTAPDFEVD
jgi:hypothetical protein